jgi:geranylgeranyl pyrophosphate synthase
MLVSGPRPRVLAFQAMDDELDAKAGGGDTGLTNGDDVQFP